MNQPHPPPPQPRVLLASAGLHAKKSWGQNFLENTEILNEIALLAGAAPDKKIIELGSGLGALTYYLLINGASVIAIERDREIVPLLRNVLAWAQERLEILEADAASLNYFALADQLKTKLTVAGNLPYQLSSRILVSLADAGSVINQAVLLVQREVAERLVSPPGSRIYGLLSVLVQRRFTATIARIVPPGAFFPRPKVHSAIVVLKVQPQQRSAQADESLVQVARAAFSHRRKMLRSALALVWHIDAALLEPVFAEANIKPTVRAEELGLDEFAYLGMLLQKHKILPSKIRGCP
ncbi:MAG: ribosomal RNA small subunit methyltransferase A [Deltaproteobacteria bacterium]|nr:ribosomal RNA small subunit methyltransferase A [Deltaproteobacteria bacterium]